MEPADGLVPIMYSEECKQQQRRVPSYRGPLADPSTLPDSDAMSCFRAIVTENEKSARVLELTEHIIRLNPAHYTVW
jgi:hypothetical protein